MKKILGIVFLILFSTCLSVNAEVIDGRFYPIEERPIASYQSIDNLVGHFNNKIEIIFSDIDGTILQFDKKNPKTEVPQSVKQAVLKLQKAKIPLILTTGRSYGEASEIAKSIGNDNTYIISQQGAEIIDSKGQIVYQDCFKNSDAQRILRKIEFFKKSHNMTFDVVVYADKKPYATKETKLPYDWEKITVIKSFEDLKNAKICNICISESSPQNLKLIQKYLKNKFPNNAIVLSSDCYCEISSKKATKGDAVKKLADILGIDLKNSATLGDAENDISMLKQVKKDGGLAIAVGNAMDMVKNNANYVTAPVTENGFAKTIDKILENNALLSK